MARRAQPEIKSIGRRVAPVTVKSTFKSTFEKIKVTTHKELASSARVVAGRISETSEFSVMFLANPVLALKEYGVELSPEMRTHVLTSLRHPTAMGQRRQELEENLNKQLGKPPKPNDSEWLAQFVFETRGLPAKAIDKLEPAFRDSFSNKTRERLEAKRPKQRVRYPNRINAAPRFNLRVRMPDASVRRLDLDAPVPATKTSKTAPKKLSLQQAWFYKDDPLVRDVVELGQIMQRGFPFKTPAEFRALAKGNRADGFRTFISGIGFKLRQP